MVVVGGFAKVCDVKEFLTGLDADERFVIERAG